MVRYILDTVGDAAATFQESSTLYSAVVQFENSHRCVTKQFKRLQKRYGKTQKKTPRLLQRDRFTRCKNKN